MSKLAILSVKTLRVFPWPCEIAHLDLRQLAGSHAAKGGLPIGTEVGRRDLTAEAGRKRDPFFFLHGFDKLIT